MGRSCVDEIGSCCARESVKGRFECESGFVKEREKRFANLSSLPLLPHHQIQLNVTQFSSSSSSGRRLWNNCHPKLLKRLG